MLKPGFSIYQARKGHISRLLILILLKLEIGDAEEWSEHWKTALREFQVIPDLLSHDPPIALGATYKIFIVNFGRLLTPFQIQNQPTRMCWPDEYGYLYTLLLTGLDAPTRHDPFQREWVHWLVVNIPGNDWNSGDPIAEYQGDSDIYGPGSHRCVYIAFKQPKRLKIHFDEKRIRNGNNDFLRANFSTDAFVKKYSLGEPIAANFFIFESDFSNATKFQQKV